MGKIAYDLEKDGEIKHFDSEKKACEFLNVKQGTVSSDYYRNRKCNGWTVIKVGNRHNESHTRLYQLWKHNVIKIMANVALSCVTNGGMIIVHLRNGH